MVSFPAHPTRSHFWPRGGASLIAALAALTGCLGEEDAPVDATAGDGGAGIAQGPGGGGAGSSDNGSGGNGNGGSGAAEGGRSGSGAATGGSGGETDGAPYGIAGQMPVTSGEQGIFEGMTAAHNATRAALQLPALDWSTALADYAQQWADTLAGSCDAIVHRSDGVYGENIAMRNSSRLTVEYSAEEAVLAWAEEEMCWGFGSIRGSETCDTSCTDALFSSGCGHYTQLVWRNTRSLGCGYASCQTGRSTMEIWVCNYDPPGNYIGQEPY
jgi:hypothetical protein